MRAVARHKSDDPIAARLRERAQATREGGGDYAAQVIAFLDGMDVDELRYLFAPHAGVAAYLWLAAAKEGTSRRVGPMYELSPPPPPVANPISPEVLSVISAAAGRALLDTMRINGRPLGDLTPRELDAWARSRRRDARFVEILTSNLPPDRPVREFRTNDDAALCWRKAEDEVHA